MQFYAYSEKICVASFELIKFYQTIYVSHARENQY
jgi:hypothetical protein